ELNMTNEEVDSIVLELLKLHDEDVEFEENVFLDLLKHSLSLNTFEKKRVIDAMPTLSQFQVDELQKVFLEEREKFKELAGEHPDDIKKLVAKQQQEWLQLGDIYKTEKEKVEKEGEEQKKIDDLKSQFGL
ncbi:MAG: hypothetical protein PHR68_02540, partial [Candidatus Gracilibacteria bacterium]|nr:hypothetical protein [Candidatus Gracilibacteria bacterium]